MSETTEQLINRMRGNLMAMRSRHAKAQEKEANGGVNYVAINYAGWVAVFTTSPAGFVRNCHLTPAIAQATTFKSEEMARRAASMVRDSNGDELRVVTERKALDLAIKGAEAALEYIDQYMSENKEA